MSQPALTSAPDAPASPITPRQAPPKALIARPEFAVVPCAVLAVCLVAGAGSEWLRGNTTAEPNWHMIVGALAGSGVAATLAVAQRSAVVRRHSSAVWLYAAATTAVIGSLAALAIQTDGLSTPYYAGMLPLAAYGGVIVPRRSLGWLLAGLFAATVAVQVANPTPLFDAAVVWVLIVASWGCGVLSGLEHARLAQLARRLGNYDGLTHSLNRRAFLRQLDRSLASDTARNAPLALLLVDLDDFSRTNAEFGDAAGDDLLGRVGTTFAGVLPADAELGRLGDDCFGVLLPNATRSEAEGVAHRIRSFLQPHTNASIGIATSQVRTLSPTDLIRVADAALRVCKREGLGLHTLVGGSTTDGPLLRALATGRPPLRYAELRSTGKVPRGIGTTELYSWISRASLGVVGVAGAAVIAGAWIRGGSGTAYALVIYGGFAWLAWVGVLTALSSRPQFTRSGLLGWVLLLNSTAAVTVGVACAALAEGGLIAPIAGVLFVKVLFDTATLPATNARVSGLLVLAGWAALAAVSPADTLWLAPFQLVLLLGCFALGTIIKRANHEMADHARLIGVTDEVTGLSNRAGFRAEAEAAFLDAVTRTGAPYAVAWFQVEHPAARSTASFEDQDRMLSLTAAALASAVPDAFAVGRTGAREFMVAVPRAGRPDVQATARLVTDQLAPLRVVDHGVAACPDDGATAEALLRAAAGLTPLTVHGSGPPGGHRAPPPAGRGTQRRRAH